MSEKTICLAVSSFILALLASSLLSGAQPLTWTHEKLWKPAQEARSCEVERNPRNIRCLFAAGLPTSTIEVTNRTPGPVDFTYDEWHSACNRPGGKVVSEAFRLETGKSLVLDVLTAGRGISCREGFIMACQWKPPEEKLPRPAPCNEVLLVKATVWKGNLQP